MFHSMVFKRLLRIFLGVLFLAASALCQTAIYRSMGYEKNTALATGAVNNLTISGGVATFGSALPTNVGVGDAIQYDSDNDGLPIDAADNIIFIHGRLSSTQFNVREPDGSTPADMATADNDWSIFRAYTDLQNAISGIYENLGIDSDLRNFDTWMACTTSVHDIVVPNQQWNIACYADTIYSYQCPTIHNWITVPGNELRIYTPYLPGEVGVSQRHSGVFDSTKFVVQSNYASGFYVNNDHVKLEGIQIKCTFIEYEFSLITIEADSVFVSDCIIMKPEKGTRYQDRGICYKNTVDADDFTWNNIIYNCNIGIKWYWCTGGNHYAYNNTVYGCNSGIEKSGSVVPVLKNNLVQNCSDGYYYDPSAGISWHASSDYNLSTMASDAPNATFTFGNSARVVMLRDSANDDFCLANGDTISIDRGQDLSDSTGCTDTTDICGQARIPGMWDIGAYELPYGERVTSVTSDSTNRVYNLNKTVDITINFSGNVTLTGGNLLCMLETGTNDRVVQIAPFGPANVCHGTYTVQNGDSTPDLTVKNLGLSAGATLRDSKNMDTRLSIPSGQNLGDNKDIKVQWDSMLLVSYHGSGTAPVILPDSFSNGAAQVSNVTGAVWVNVPASLWKLTYLLTSRADKDDARLEDSVMYVVNLGVACTVFCLIDGGATSAPQWILADSWEPTTRTVTGGGVAYQIYRKYMGPGDINLKRRKAATSMGTGYVFRTRAPGSPGIKGRALAGEVIGTRIGVMYGTARGVEFHLPLVEAGNYNLAVYNVAGQRLWSYAGAVLQPVREIVRWKTAGAERGIGIYFAVLNQKEHRLVEKFTIIE